MCRKRFICNSTQKMSLLDRYLWNGCPEKSHLSVWQPKAMWTAKENQTFLADQKHFSTFILILGELLCWFQRDINRVVFVEKKSLYWTEDIYWWPITLFTEHMDKFPQLHFCREDKQWELQMSSSWPEHRKRHISSEDFNYILHVKLKDQQVMALKVFCVAAGGMSEGS